MGNTVGSPPLDTKLSKRSDPVTTDSADRRMRSSIAGSHARSSTGSINPFYVSGYVDGEGCFTISFSPRSKLKTGWEVRPSFSVSQNNDRAEILYQLIDYFGCGRIRPDRSDKTLKYEVRSINLLIEKIIPHFQSYPLKSSKQRDFECFAEVCKKVSQGRHLLPEGIKEIAEIAVTMNPSGKRKYTNFLPVEVKV